MRNQGKPGNGLTKSENNLPREEEDGGIEGRSIRKSKYRLDKSFGDLSQKDWTRIQ